MARSKYKAINANLPPQEPNERDKAAIAHAAERVLARRKRVSVALQGEIADLKVAPPHADTAGHNMQLLDALGTASHAFVNCSLSDLMNALIDRGVKSPNETQVNAALAVIDGIKPTNEMEALLALQMAATHSLAMNMLGRARRVEQLNQVEVQGGLAIKLLRTFTLQTEALAKLRRGGGQTVRVEHVHVHAGGQAIVGSVTPGGGVPPKTEEQPHAKQVSSSSNADALCTALRSTDPQRGRVQVPGNA